MKPDLLPFAKHRTGWLVWSDLFESQVAHTYVKAMHGGIFLAFVFFWTLKKRPALYIPFGLVLFE